jgi:hypothetical protein
MPTPTGATAQTSRFFTHVRGKKKRALTPFQA